jgi:hypothetical protein
VRVVGILAGVLLVGGVLGAGVPIVHAGASGEVKKGVRVSEALASEAVREQLVQMVWRQEQGKRLSDFRVVQEVAEGNWCYVYGTWRLDGAEHDVMAVAEQRVPSGAWHVMGMGTSPLPGKYAVNSGMAGGHDRLMVAGTVNDKAIVAMRVLSAEEKLGEVPVEGRYYVAVVKMTKEQKRRVRVQGVDREGKVLFDSWR